MQRSVEKNIAPAPKITLQQRGTEIERILEDKGSPDLRGLEHAKTDQLRQQTGDPNMEAKSGGISTIPNEPSQIDMDKYAQEKKNERKLRKDMVEPLETQRERLLLMKQKDEHRAFHPKEAGTGIPPLEIGSVRRAEHVPRTGGLENLPEGEVNSNKQNAITDVHGHPMGQDLTESQDRPTLVPHSKAQARSFAEVTAIERDPDIGWNEDPDEARKRRINNPPTGPAHGPEGGEIRHSQPHVEEVQGIAGMGRNISDDFGLPSTKLMRDLQGQGHVMTVTDPSLVVIKDNELDAALSSVLPPLHRVTQ